MWILYLIIFFSSLWLTVGGLALVSKVTYDDGPEDKLLKVIVLVKKYFKTTILCWVIVSISLFILIYLCFSGFQV